MGFLGIGAYLFVILAIAYHAFALMRSQCSEKSGETIALAAVVGLIGMLVASIFDVIILRPQVQIFVLYLLAVLRHEVLKNQYLPGNKHTI